MSVEITTGWVPRWFMHKMVYAMVRFRAFRSCWELEGREGEAGKMRFGGGREEKRWDRRTIRKAVLLVRAAAVRSIRNENGVGLRKMPRRTIPDKLQAWIDARKKYHLSHAQVQMARELGMNPKKLGGKANHRQEPWKIPLPNYIEHLYEKRFGKPRPDLLLSIEESFKQDQQKRAERAERKRQRRLEIKPQQTEESHGPRRCV